MKFHRRASVVLVSSLLALSYGGSVLAATASNTSKTTATNDPTTTTVTGDGSVQNYTADSDLQIGTIVQLLSPSSAKKVAAANQKDPRKMYGVVVDPHQLSVTLSNTSAAHEVFVATSGAYNVLVSDQAGQIKQDDYITISSVDGVGMDAGTTGVTVFGRALNGFNGKTNVLGSAQLKDTTGKAAKTVNFGMIPVAIGIVRNPAEKSTKANLPKALQKVGQAIADKPVSPVRIYLGTFVALLSVFIAMVMAYSGIRSSTIAIGRNPLAKTAVFKGLFSVILAVIIVLIIGLFAVYLLLKL